MHKCKKCGEEFENIGLLLLHYKEHKKEEPDDDIDELEIEDDIEEKIEEEPQKKTIPIDYCPREVRLLAEKQIVGLKILGMKKGDEIIINDVYLL